MTLRFSSAMSGRTAIVAILPVLLAVAAARAEFAENFDGVVAPALPASWTTAEFGFTWTTTTDTPDTAPNCVAATSLDHVSEAYLDSPLIQVGLTTHLVSFRHRFQLEAAAAEDQDPTIGYDGGVLEIAIGPSDFQDITAAGGEFLDGGYTRIISSQKGSLISGRPAWSGDSGGYVATIIRLPTSTLNSTIRLRFRLSADRTNGGGVWAIDSIDTADECGFRDTQPPTVVCPAGITRVTPMNACAAHQITLGDVTGIATITDNCSTPLVVTQDPPAETVFGPGTAQVTITAVDMAGNVGSCTTTLTVIDSLGPGTCGVCCGAGMVEALLVMCISHAGMKLSRRRMRPRNRWKSSCM